MSDWFSALYDAVTAQLEHELDGAGYDGDSDAVEALERVKQAVVDVNTARRAASSDVSAAITE